MAAIAMGVVACGPSGADLGTASGGSGEVATATEVHPITNGTPDANPADAAVVVLILGPRLCSGTLIAPEVVLTAAHCVAGITAAQTQVGFGPDVRSKQITWIKAAALQAHPKYDPKLLVNDLALVRLSSPPPASATPIPILPPTLALTNANVGMPVQFAGYGTTSAVLQTSAGTKMDVGASLDFVCTGPAACDYLGARASPNTICYNQQPGGPCMGDSGGPAFVTINGQRYVAGVTSYGDPLCTSYGCSTKIDAFEPFIASFAGAVAAANGTSCMSALDCKSGFCAEGVCCDAACTGAPCQTCLAAHGASADGACTPLSGSCDDGDSCTQNDQCQNGQCVGQTIAGCVVPECSPTVCDPATGKCDPKALADGTACDDGNPCTVRDACRAGSCVGELPLCPTTGACAGACTMAEQSPKRAGCGYGFGEADPLLAIAALVMLLRRRTTPRVLAE